MDNWNQIEIFIRTVLSLLAVLGLILVIAWGARRYLHLEKWMSKKEDGMNVLHTYRLEPKKKLMVIEIEKKRMLLGITEGSVSYLCGLGETKESAHES